MAEVTRTRSHKNKTKNRLHNPKLVISHNKKSVIFSLKHKCLFLFSFGFNHCDVDYEFMSFKIQFSSRVNQIFGGFTLQLHPCQAPSCPVASSGFRWAHGTRRHTFLRRGFSPSCGTFFPLWCQAWDVEETSLLSGQLWRELRGATATAAAAAAAAAAAVLLLLLATATCSCTWSDLWGARAGSPSASGGSGRR